MKHACLIAHHFPGLGNPLKLDVDDFWKALDNAIELNERHANG